MSSKVALLAGASGLVGKELLTFLLNEPSYSKVIVLVRRPLAILHPKLVQYEVDFSTTGFENDKVKNLSIDQAFCTLGTTIKCGGTRAAFRQVDQQFVVNVAQMVKDNGAELFCVVTAMAANSDSMIFYNRVKGDVEKELQQLNFKFLASFRPSMLVGDRLEQRFAEKLGSVFLTVFDFLIPKNYKVIAVKKVALAMLGYAKDPVIGFSIIPSKVMNNRLND
jgi:uncharacterized protein YbjT (DUF2867 family)